MKLYKVPAGVETQVIKDGLPWEPRFFQKHVTRHDNFFEKQDILFDRIVMQRVKFPVLQQNLIKHGFCAFRRDGYVLLVHESKVSLAG